jgi:hypothetical protein
MSQLYEIATLAFPLLSGAQVAEATQAWVSAPDAQGEVLGRWRTELGQLGRMLILRRFDSNETLAQERQRTLLSASPFNAGQFLTALEMDSYTPFPFLPPAQPGARGPVYEFRTYRLKPGGLPPTLAGWEKAIGPARDYTSHLVINMYAQAGPPRITHIWGFESLEQRAALRAAAYSAGVWPPNGGPENILDATSTIALPEADSRLC